MEKNAIQFATVPAPVFFSQLLANTKEGYFADPLYGGNRGMGAWEGIGFPGARAGFTDWIDQAGRAHPYCPVAISGARGRWGGVGSGETLFLSAFGGAGRFLG